MDWRNISNSVSKALQTAQQLGNQASELAQKAIAGIDTLKNATDILQSDDKIVDKGMKIASLATETFKRSTGETIERESTALEEKLNKAEKTNLPDNRSNDRLIEPAEILEPEVVEIESYQSFMSDLPCGIGTAAEAITALAMMGTEIAKAVQVCQIEETKRTEIKARMEVELSRINAISNLMTDYLNRTFDERADLFDEYFKTLDKAIISGDNELMAATLGSINSLAAQSPFKNLTDLSAVQNQLGCANEEWDI